MKGYLIVREDALENKRKYLKCLEDEFESFKRKINNHKYVCLFGTGKCAEHWGYEFVKEYLDESTNILFFTDNNSDYWGKTVVDGLQCLPPDSLVEYGRDIICIILVGSSNVNKIKKQLENQGTEAVTIRMEWVYIDQLIEKYLNITLPDIWEGESDMGRYHKNIDESEKIAVYTCIVGGYDELLQPSIKDSRCDYYCLSLERPQKLGIYQWINIADQVPSSLEGDYTRINRYCKVHPHLLFPQYHYSIYVDGNISIHTKLSHLTQNIGRIGIASYGMRSADDVYEHATSLYIRNGLGEEEARERISKQMQQYAQEGFPHYFGFTENGVMIREHDNEKCIRVMETWWNEILNNSRRDQLSFMYSVWKNGFVPQDIGYIADTWREGPEFSINAHKKDHFKVKKFYRS